MIRCAEAVLDGHPDKFCDIIADRLVQLAMDVDPASCAQVEVGIWSDQIWLSGAIVSEIEFEFDAKQLITEIGSEIGYTQDNHIDAAKYQISDHVCRVIADPLDYADYYADQCITIGWAGYDKKTHFLPPEQFLAHRFREALAEATRPKSEMALSGEGPDGKLLVRLRENFGGEEWCLEHILVTLQHRPDTSLADLNEHVLELLEGVYTKIVKDDPRWVLPFNSIAIRVNPNGAFYEGGSDSDNGQTGRKLVIDYYGPHIPIGGGALSGKSLHYIDRLAAYAARQLAVETVQEGAKDCLVQLNYAPGVIDPLDVYISASVASKVEKETLTKQEILKKYQNTKIGHLGCGTHFFDLNLLWNTVQE